VLTGGLHLSEGEKKTKGYRFGFPSWAGSAGLGPGSAQVGWPLPFFFFFCSDSFSIFCFSLFFITFAFWLQTDSNNFVIFSKIQSIKVGQ
jgi:hypothetical protein